MSSDIQEKVKDYYGSVLETSEDLKTSACCVGEAPPRHIQDLLKNVHETVQAKFYGCGTPLPVIKEGAVVLDLGCGTGRDVYVLSQIVGAKGRVIGVDMTDEQLNVASEYIDWHMEKFGFTKPNVEFKKGYIEDLKTIGIEDNSVDLVVSNCVINLSDDKPAVFSEIARVLKPGGVLLATLCAARDQDWWHVPSSGWCYTGDSLKNMFQFGDDTPSNYDQYDQLFNQDTQVKHREMVIYAEDEELGSVPHIRTPIKMGDKIAVRRVAPKLGEHNAEVLGGVGVSAEELAALKTKGVV